MKTSKLLFYFLFLPCFLLAQEKEFSIQGKIGSKVPVKVYLMYPSGSGYKPDSSDVKNGAFSFTGKVHDIMQAFIYFDYSGTGMRFGNNMSAPDVLSVKLSNESLQVATADSIKNGVITGSQLNNEAKIFTNSLQGIKSLDDPKVLPAVKAFIEKYPKSPICFDAINYLTMGGTEYNQILAVYELIDKSMRESPQGQEMLAKVQARNKPIPKTGDAAPDFTLNSDEGKPVSMKEFRGKYVLVDFWASWCGPCRKENPHVVAAYQKFKGEKFDILGVSIDKANQRKAWLEAIKKDGLVWAQVCDEQGIVAIQYDVKSIPSNFLIDPQGKIIAKNLRGEDLEAKLAEIFGK